MNFQRQLDIFDPKSFCFPVTIIGCGGIGSPTALVLAKVGCPGFTIMDPDTIEEHNLPNQLFRMSDAGQPKVMACKRLVEEFSECSVRALSELFGETKELPGIIISCVDNMDVRKVIWERARYNANVPLLIDGRLGGTILEVFTIQPCCLEDVEFYEKHLFPQSESRELPCTGRAIMYMGFMIAGLIVAQLTLWLKGGKHQRRINMDLKTMISVVQ